MNTQSEQPSPQATPTTAQDAPSALVVRTFEVTRADGDVIVTFFSGNQPPATISIGSEHLGKFIAALEDAARSA